MKKPTPASQKKVTPENLARLGAERLAHILAGVAATRPELKRRLRMELAAEQGGEALALEIDKRLSALETSRSKVSWRQRATFIRDLDGLRGLVAERLASLDRPAALDRLWRFLGVARRVAGRVRDRDGALARVFARAAEDLGGLLAGEGEHVAPALAEAMVHDPTGWADWLPVVLVKAPPELAQRALRELSARSGATAAWMPLLRRLAEAAGDVDAYRATFAEAALRTPAVAGEVAQRLLAAGRLDEARRLLEAARPQKPGRRVWSVAALAEPDPTWETAWIDVLEQSGDTAGAQAARWSAFERTLSVDAARAFVARLPDFEDVEAEGRAFDHAAAHSDFERGLAFLMAWPALREAAAMIEARAEEVSVSPESAELWSARLRARYPAAAHRLLRKAAAAAFRRRDLATCDRLTQEADAIDL